jgi:hypothetical protein
MILFCRPSCGEKDRRPEEKADGFIGLSVLSTSTELDLGAARMRLTEVTRLDPGGRARCHPGAVSHDAERADQRRDRI